jgi:hypothetical protein
MIIAGITKIRYVESLEEEFMNPAARISIPKFIDANAE